MPQDTPDQPDEMNEKNLAMLKGFIKRDFVYIVAMLILLACCLWLVLQVVNAELICEERTQRTLDSLMGSSQGRIRNISVTLNGSLWPPNEATTG